ncbi:thiamine pyrophosphate-binding protein [Sandaracinus amylolyticus]|uniref:thiamine pyrophosphate-binding protein n=1 Tax=Sandaracinus amylolyticus TaxID=927083 RepID=UPI001F350D5E|nr:thiamine pyrophosphate-binding protein [Sandaracinus amylolyticus]UJR81343.1 Acetolactate synthase large subunit [Sandaracinus amylolyticus]
MKGTVALQLVDVLRDFGVDVVFGIPGGAISALYAALLERPDVRIITTKHESTAAFLAIGYAIATGRPGVVLTTAGPGITNAVTGVASAFYEGVPVVHIAGEVARSAFGRGALQEGSPAGFDAVAIMRRVTKMSVMLSHPGPATSVLRKALSTAYSGRRGPVFVSLPLDVACAHVESQPLSGSVRTTFEIDSDATRRALDMLERAQRPLILAGAGTRDLSGRRALRRLAEHVGAPVCVTTKGKGVFPEDHPLFLGVLGFGGHDSVISYLERGVDVLLAVGSGLNDFTTNAWSPLLRATRAFLQIDIDSAQLGKNYPIDLGLVGPADQVIGRMLEHRSDERISKPLGRGPSLVETQPLVPSPSGALTTMEVVLAMNEACPRDAVFTADMGEHLSVALHYLRVSEHGDFITCLGFGSMGSGIATAIGHQLGAPQRRTFAICGDGGFLMYGNELATAVQHGLRVTFVVMNDSRLNMVHHGMHDLFGRAPDFTTSPVDFALMARSMGAEGHVVRTRLDLVRLLSDEADGPVVLDVRFDPDVRLAGNQRVAALKQFGSSENDG